jgi:hypothetical protein
MVKPPCGSARPAQHAAHLPTHGGGAEHPAARKHRALATIRPVAARREMASRGMETTDSHRLTATPASPEASDALLGTPLPHAEKRARWALAGFLGAGTPRVRGRRAPCRSPKPTSPGLRGRRGGRTDRCAGRSSRYRPRSAMASASSNRMVKGLPKTGFGLGQPATLGLRLSRFHGFPLSGDRPTRGMACRGRAPADADVHGRRPSGGTFRRSSRRCCSQW